MGKIVRYACHVLVLFVVLANCLPPISEPVINTQWGPIRGKWSNSLNGRPVANFLGIPYALPPVGDLRFQSPQRWNRTWTTVRDGTIDGQKCTQLHKSKVIGSEDCLYLNVFAPMIPENRPAKLPVMVYLHGGKFATGSSDSKLYAPDYLMNYNVIFVTLNYRLNVLGFFSTATRVAPGNYGLKDIVAALHWVQENIYDFGGNPESVTVMGSSSGAALTHLLALTEKTEGLFHRYILHSGTALSTWAVHFKQSYRRTCLKLARLVGCLPNATTSNETIVAADSEREIWQCDGVYDASDNNVEQDEEMMKCMRTVNTSEMLKMTQEMFVWMTSPCCPFGPTLEEESEEAIVTVNPFKLMKDGLFRDIPAIMQVVKDEGLIVSLDFFKNHNTVNEMILNFEQYLPYLIEYQNIISNTSMFADAIRDFYFNGNLTESNFLNNITDIVSDGSFKWPLIQSVKYQSKMGKANVYVSLFAYQGTFSWIFKSDPHVYDNIHGVSHGDDLNYLLPYLNNMYADKTLHNTENDLKMINIMTETWTNFATYGVPSARMIPTWPNYRDHHQFMRFGVDKSPDTAVQVDFLPARMKFWEKLMANVSTKCNIEPDVFVADSSENI